MDKPGFILSSITTFAHTDSQRFERFCTYAPQLKQAPLQAALVYIEQNANITIDIDQLNLQMSTQLYILVDQHADVSCMHMIQRVHEITLVMAPYAQIRYDIRHDILQDTTLKLCTIQQRATMSTITIMSVASLRAEIVVLLQEELAEADVRVAALADQDQKNTLQTIQQHSAARTKSSVRVKTVLDGTAHYHHQGMLEVAYGATGVIAYEQSDHMLISAKAQAYVVPAMQVRNHDVQCMHASALGNVDMQLLWYMQSRGLDELQARTLLLQAFFAEICTASPHLARAVHHALQTYSPQ